MFGMYACMCNGYVWLGESVSVFDLVFCAPSCIYKSREQNTGSTSAVSVPA